MCYNKQADCGARSCESKNAVIAQSVERVIGNDEVGSSNLPNSSKKSTVEAVLFFFCFYAPAGGFELPTSAEGDSISNGC